MDFISVLYACLHKRVGTKKKHERSSIWSQFQKSHDLSSNYYWIPSALTRSVQKNPGRDGMENPLEIPGWLVLEGWGHSEILAWWQRGFDVSVFVSGEAGQGCLRQERKILFSREHWFTLQLRLYTQSYRLGNLEHAIRVNVITFQSPSEVIYLRVSLWHTSGRCL